PDGCEEPDRPGHRRSYLKRLLQEADCSAHAYRARRRRLSSGMSPKDPEPWMRGPVEGIPPLLMPVAHALQQAYEDIGEVLGRLTTDQLWVRPGGAASVGFHVRHIAGALDRLF